MRKMIIGLLFAAGFLFAADVTVYVSGQVVDNGAGGTLDIYMQNTADVYGFQFDMDVSGLVGDGTASFTGAAGGTAGALGFITSTNSSGTVLGFSLTGAFIPAGEGVMTVVSWDADTQALSGPVTLEVTNFAGIGGSALTYEVGATFLSNDDITIVDEYKLSDNYPNPFNPSTTIGYDVKEAGDVSIIIYDMLGREVKTLVNEYMLPNSYNVIWNGINDQGLQAASGVYYYKMISNDFVDTKKMMFVK